jgi:hypothetical protein
MTPVTGASRGADAGAQDALNTAVSSLPIRVVQLVIGPPMHTPGLFREWLQKIYSPVQTHSNFLGFCKPTPTS